MLEFEQWWWHERKTFMDPNPSARRGAIRAWNYRGEKIREQQARIEALKEELDRFKNGYQGGCYACEIVGQKNIELSKYIEEITGSKYD